MVLRPWGWALWSLLVLLEAVIIGWEHCVMRMAVPVSRPLAAAEVGTPEHLQLASDLVQFLVRRPAWCGAAGFDVGQAVLVMAFAGQQHPDVYTNPDFMPDPLHTTRTRRPFPSPCERHHVATLADRVATRPLRDHGVLRYLGVDGREARLPLQGERAWCAQWLLNHMHRAWSCEIVK